MAAAVLKPLAEIGASIHMVAHAFGKITLFFAAGAIYTASDLGNIWMLMGDASSLDQALTCFNLALENYQGSNDQRNHLEANLLSKKARCYRRQNDLESARDTYQAAYDLFEPQDLRSEPAGHRFGLSLANS